MSLIFWCWNEKMILSFFQCLSIILFHYCMNFGFTLSSKAHQVKFIHKLNGDQGQPVCDLWTSWSQRLFPQNLKFYNALCNSPSYSFLAIGYGWYLMTGNSFNLTPSKGLPKTNNILQSAETITMNRQHEDAFISRVWWWQVFLCKESFLYIHRDKALGILWFHQG